MKSRHEQQRQQLMRRTFLKAVGLGIAAPLAYKMSRLAVAQTDARPTRLFIMYLPHGAPVEHYDPGDGFNLDASGVGILSPLEPYKQYLNVLRGVEMNDGAENHAAVRAVLTGFNNGKDANSIDFTIAQALGTQAHVLGVQPHRGWGLDDDSRLVKHGDWVTPIDNPADALEDLFAGLGAGGSTSQPASDESAFRAAALGLTEREIEALQREVAGLTAEENKLKLHLEAIQSLKAGGGGGIGVVSCDARPSLPTAESMAGKDAFVHEHFGTVLDGHLEAAAHAFVCGTAQVITLQVMYANAQILMNFPGGPGFASNHHDPLSHSADTAGRTDFAEVQKWFYSRLAEKFLAVLDQPDPADPEHTVLDNTVVFVCTEIGDGMLHNGKTQEIWLDGKGRPAYLPFVLIGGGGGFLKMGGQFANTPVPHTNILATLAAAMGAPISTIRGQNVSVPEVLRA